ncbi:MAG: SEC-C metal-binding domain-containing protein [Nanoarchaeota archaeon]|nr:SEC-C metal-binding domain-containing protein [Nanoarchaeota archaeon]
MNHTTPNSINEDVLEFCKEINTSEEPFFVEVVPYEKSEFQECFSNVEDYIKKFGGKMQIGWTIWEIPKKFMEAEFHAIWVREDGAYMDISPKPDGEKKILFLKDSENKFKGKPVNNIRKALVDTIEIRAIIVRGDKFFELQSKYFDGSKSKIPSFEMKKLEDFMEEFLSAEIKKDKLAGKIKIGRNELCPCDSGKKYKKCCMSLIKRNN